MVNQELILILYDLVQVMVKNHPSFPIAIYLTLCKIDADHLK